MPRTAPQPDRPPPRGERWAARALAATPAAFGVGALAYAFTRHTSPFVAGVAMAVAAVGGLVALNLFAFGAWREPPR